MALRSWTRRRMFIVVCVLLTLGVLRLWPHYDDAGEFPQHPEAIHLARSLAFHGEFANPFRLMPSGPSAYLSPLFPGFLSLLIRIFGIGASGNFAFRFAAALATAAELALLPVLTEVTGVGLTPGVLACILGLLPPVLTFPDWEMSYAGLLIVIATILWLRFLKNPATVGASMGLGFVLGLLLLTSASALPVLLVWLAYAVLRFRASQFSYRRWIAVVTVFMMLTPWTARNYRVFHRFIPFRTALGLALEASNNDCALIGVRQSERSGCFGQHSPNHNPVEAERARTMGEVAYNAAKLEETRQWIRAHPRRFAALTWGRFCAFWLPHEAQSWPQEITTPTSRRRERLTIYLATVLSVPGILWLFRVNREAALTLASWLTLFPPVYYIALFEDRYRYPILWVTLVCAAYAVCRSGSWIRSRVISPELEAREKSNELQSRNASERAT